MRKVCFVCCLLALGAAGLCPGAANDTLLVFSTPGPDAYGDGTTVLDGERYALVWQRDGTSFAGFTADCRPVVPKDTRIVVAAPLAKGGRCPETVFEVDAAYAATFAGGSFALYLLDTRVRGLDGATQLAAAGRAGVPRTVNAAGAAGSAGAVSLAKVGVYAKIDEPRIDAIRVYGAKVELKVSGMSETADYFVVQGAEPGKVGSSLETTVSGDTLTVGKPAGGAMFFRVLGVRKFR